MIKVAIIGVGNMGKNHARIYSELKDVDLVAVADTNETVKNEAKKYGAKYYKNYLEMLEKEDIACVSIATPTKSHKQITLDATAHGKHVLVEKPIALTTEEGKEMIQAAKEKRVILMVGHVERFNPVITSLKKEIENGTIGKILSVNVKRIGPFPLGIVDMNVFQDLAIHDVDVIRYVLNKDIVKIFSGGGISLTENIMDFGQILLRLEDNITAVIETNWVTPVKVREMSLVGDKGYLKANLITQELELYKTVVDKKIDNFGEYVMKFGNPIRYSIDVIRGEPLKLELQHFIDCVKNNKQPIISPEDALRALEIVNLASKVVHEIF